MKNRNFAVIGAACGYGAQKHGCQDAPEVLQSFGFLEYLNELGITYYWDNIIHLHEDQYRTPLSSVSIFSKQLALKVRDAKLRGDFPIVLGGDHSCAIGTWSGVKASMPKNDRLGLLWIDAHMDSHTYASTPSNAIHGMPLACLLGHGDDNLIHIGDDLPKLHPEDICLIGTRSYEEGEAKLLEQLGVRVFHMGEINHRGLDAVWAEALSIVQRKTVGFGISLDLDVLDPSEEPGVGSPEPGGMSKKMLEEMLGTLKINSKLLALEIVEYNPYLDMQFVTASAVCDLVAAIRA
ncbi:MAG: arginase [Gallionellaceae bacterium]|nr:arginase [Gallionellaceae bacterium]